MFRKNEVKIAPYKAKGYFIRPAGVCDEYELGKWYTYKIRKSLCYSHDKNYSILYADTVYKMKKFDHLIGYFIVKRLFSFSLPFLASGDRIIKLLDFAVISPDYKDDAKVLLTYLTNYAKKQGCGAIEIGTKESFPSFYKFVKEHFLTKKFDKKLYILVQNPKMIASEKFFRPLEEDNISIQDLSFLYNLNFTLNKKTCTLKLNESEKIVVDRKSKKVTLPTIVKNSLQPIILDNNSKQLIYYIIKCYQIGEVDNIIINEQTKSLGIYAQSNDSALVFKSSNDVFADKQLAKELESKTTLKYIIPSHFSYDWVNESFCESFVKIKIEKILSSGKK